MKLEKFDLECKILDCNNKELIRSTAECLSETFAGIKVGNAVIKEPMCAVCNMTIEDMIPYVEDYLNTIASQNLCGIAIDKNTNKVIGASACESFDPDFNPSIMDGDLKNITMIQKVVAELDKKFIRHVGIQNNDKYVHGVMIGVRAEKDKKHIAAELLKVIEKSAKQQNYTGMIVEATNIRSQKFNIRNGYEVVTDKNNIPISIIYSEHETFKNIPKEYGTDCKLMLKKF